MAELSREKQFYFSIAGEALDVLRAARNRDAQDSADASTTDAEVGIDPIDPSLAVRLQIEGMPDESTFRFRSPRRVTTE
jgi:hypothetical protein